MVDTEKLRELMRLHDEAFEAAMRVDGHCKSSEGHVSLSFTNVFERQDGEDPLTVVSVGVYSYVLGPSRQHWFDSIDEALDAVRKWHDETMEWVRDEEDQPPLLASP